MHPVTGPEVIFWFLQEWYSKRNNLKHGLLFFVTLITTTFGRRRMVYGKSILAYWRWFSHFGILLEINGLLIPLFLGNSSWFMSLAISLLRSIKSECTLAFFKFQVWLGFFIGAESIGTFGAVIQMKGRVNSRKKILWYRCCRSHWRVLLFALQCCLWILDFTRGRLYLFGSSWICWSQKFQG